MTPAFRLFRLRTASCTFGAAVVLCCVGCGYMVGGPYRQDVRTVNVPIFKNTGFRRDYEFQLTEAVHKEIQKQTTFRLAKEGEADTKLSGRIVSISKSPLSESAYDDPRELQLNMAIKVTWEDLRGGPSVLATRKIEIPPDVVRLLSSADMAPELGQSMATARQRAIDNLARQIVQLMQTPW